LLSGGRETRAATRTGFAAAECSYFPQSEGTEVEREVYCFSIHDAALHTSHAAVSQLTTRTKKTYVPTTYRVAQKQAIE